jgi:hypothetical protein
MGPGLYSIDPSGTIDPLLYIALAITLRASAAHWILRRINDSSHGEARVRVADAARAVGVSAELIRKLERRGVIAIPRYLNGHSRLTSSDVEALRRVIFRGRAQRVRLMRCPAPHVAAVDCRRPRVPMPRTLLGAALMLVLLALASPASATFPTLAATNNSIESSNVTTHKMSLPANIAAGNLLICVAAIDSTVDVGFTLTAPSGWTLLLKEAGSSESLAAWYRFEDGGEGATPDFETSTLQQSAHRCARFSGMHASAAPESAPAELTSSTAPDPPSLMPTWGAKDALYLAVTGWSEGTITASAFPASYTSTGQNGTGVAGSEGVSIGWGFREVNAVSEDPGTFTLSSAANWISFTIAIRPAVECAARINLIGIGC